VITSTDKVVTDIVAEGRRRLRATRTREGKIKENWRELKAKGFGYSEHHMTPAILDYDEGRYLYEVMPDESWKGRRCFIIGGGESLKSFDFSKLKNELVIGVNRAYEKIDCTINFAMDNTFYDWIVKGKLGDKAKRRFDDYKGYKVWLDTVGYDYPKGIFIVKKAKPQAVNYNLKDGIRGGTNAGFGALGLAVCLGANPIYLLGFDMKGRDGKSAQWHSGYPEKQGEGVYGAMINDFKKVAQPLMDKEVKVINLNSESELKCFGFQDIEDIKMKPYPVITSFYTKNTPYEKQVELLKATLKRFNLDNDVEGVEDLGDWHKNVFQKPKFIMRMLKKYPGRPIVYVDADAKFRRSPTLFNELECDFAVHFRQGHELLSGTLYFGNTKGSRFIVEKWLEEDIRSPMTHMPQRNLRTVFDRHKKDIIWKELPVEYCMIFDSRARFQVPTVVEHFQLSRIHKNNDKKRKYSMEQSLDEIKALCKGKRMCIIGNADSVLNKEKDIDSFDVIGRMNRGEPQGKEKYLGSRTDILFLSTSMSGKNIQTAFAPKYILWMTVCNRLAQPWVLRNAVQNPRRDWQVLYDELGINPTTGLMSLKFVLDHIEFKSLTIYGFDFFKTKTWYNTKIDDGQKHSGEKEEGLFMGMIKHIKNVEFV
jgi:hypothetical protein